MKTTSKNWSEKDLQIYLMLYCLHTDWASDPKQKLASKNDICPIQLEEICSEFNSDNDFQGIQKIYSNIISFYESRSKKISFLQQMQKLILDGDGYNFARESLLKGIERMVLFN